jgi:hypothetical protein
METATTRDASSVAFNNVDDGADQTEMSRSPERILVHRLLVPLETKAGSAGGNFLPSSVGRGRGIGTSTARAAIESIVSPSNTATASSCRIGCVEVIEEQRSYELGRLDLRKVSDRRRAVQHDDVGKRSLVSNTG